MVVDPDRAPIEGGRLYVVATPIGNLQDITLRALEVLRSVSVLVAEDTRVARRLLSHFEIPTPPHLVSYREENRERAAEQVLGLLRQGLAAALVTDAGMPGISDPGDLLVARCHDAGIAVSPIPGPSAFLAAVAASGIPSARIAFEGFLSRRGSHRKERLRELAAEPRTVVLFEAPSRVAETLAELAAALGGTRRGCVAREITKKFEEIRTGTLDELAAWAGDHEMRGEFAIVVAGRTGEAPPEVAEAAADPAAMVADRMAGGMSHKDAAREVARLLGLARRDVYRLSQGSDDDDRSM